MFLSAVDYVTFLANIIILATIIWPQISMEHPKENITQLTDE